MHTIALAKKINYQAGANPNEGKIIVEPLYPGFGITLGNSLRRVLVSSLPGAAVIGVKIKDVKHEFTTLPHLKEDVLEFILNLKQLRLKVFGNEVVKLELKVHGEKKITAADISKNSAVEIVNPELVLGHITDMSGSLTAEIFVSQGLGYEMIENRGKQSSEINYIDMDSIFSPVLGTGIEVENVRVGKVTNWDKLILDIKTDGTISPEEAFKSSVAVLIKQFNALLMEEKKVEKEAEEEDKEEKKDEKKEAEEKDKEEKAEPVKKKRGRPKKED